MSDNTAKVKKPLVKLIFISFFLHIVWENAQAPLYLGYVSLSEQFFICFIGTIGDVVFTLAVYCCVALISGNYLWFLKTKNKYFLILGFVGLIFAIIVEKVALTFGIWGYKKLMPTIPYLNVGITPLLQMTMLLPSSFYIAGKLQNKNSDNA